MIYHLRMACVALAIFASAGDAQILLKPNGQNAAPLRVKALAANVDMRGQFATTALNYTFQNESSERVEADFIYTVPEHAVVSYFAYWYGEEKVVARVVEKKRAARIYQYITTRQRDPALVEMIGKNTFRARIFPVMPNADLKVEIHLAQTLSMDKQGAFYELPLRSDGKSVRTFEQLDVKIKATPDANEQAELFNNFGLSAAPQNAQWLLELSRRNYRAPQNLRVRFRQKLEGFRASLFAARSDGPHGFFALALTPNRSLRRPRVAISGVTTYDVTPRRLPPVRANQPLILTGRYKSSGQALVTLTDSGKANTVAVNFSDAAEKHNIATKLWASRRIAELSRNNYNRAKVIALCKQFTLPGKWTSWLAIPREELQRYHAEMTAADLDYYGQDLVRQIAGGRSQSAAARQLRARFDAVCVANKLDKSAEFKARVEARLNDLSWGLNNLGGDKQSRRKRQTFRREIIRLAKINGVSATDYLNGSPPSYWGGGGGGGGFQSGDPLISIEAPHDAQQVIALLPGGDIKRLQYDSAAQRWQARFDIPTYAMEGAYAITIVIVLKDGTRRTMVLRYRVDESAPAGRGKAQIVAGEASEVNLRLEIEADQDTARVAALLPWGEKIDLQPSTIMHNGYFALAKIPADFRGSALQITYVLTDRAHNRTTVTIDTTN